jgi:hypothetical protein
LWFLLGAALVRCSLFVDTDGLSGGGGIDGSTFDSTSDAQASGDSGVDSGNSSDAANAIDAQFPGCGAPHAACDDFETASFSDRWNGGSVNNGGVVEYVDDASVSPTHAMHSSMPATGAGASAALYQNLVTTATSIHCQLYILIRPTNPNAWNALGLGFAGDDAGVANYYTSVSVGETQTQIYRVANFVDGGGDYDEQDVPAIQVDTWTSLVLDMQPSGGTEMVTVTLGDGAPHTRQFEAPPGATLTQIVVSQDYSTTPVDMLVDNVLCDVVP